VSNFAFEPERNSACDPSGDSDTPPSWTLFFVNCTAAEPSAFITQTSLSLLVPISGVGAR
jgi:hypothetical protein